MVELVPQWGNSRVMQLRAMVRVTDTEPSGAVAWLELSTSYIETMACNMVLVVAIGVAPWASSRAQASNG